MSSGQLCLMAAGNTILNQERVVATLHANIPLDWAEHSDLDQPLHEQHAESRWRGRSEDVQAEAAIFLEIADKLLEVDCRQRLPRPFVNAPIQSLEAELPGTKKTAR